MLGNILPPYHSLQELNLDWILTKVKDMLRFLPDDGTVGQILRRTAHGAEWSDEQGAGGSVTSVNGQQGAVVLTAADVGALADTTPIPTAVSDLNNDLGFVDAAGAAAAAPVQRVNGQTGNVSITKGNVGLGNVDNVQQYSASNPPPYPVTSVNGQTGAVSLTIPEANVSAAGYCKMPDGTLICWGSFQVLNSEFSSPSAYGAMYYCTATLSVPFGVSFIAPPAISVLSVYNVLDVLLAQRDENGLTNLYVMRHVNSKPPDSEFTFTAMGRWKA